ncbi:E3 ubiquitin-protein ligase RNF14-like [Hylaeus anthracinus]|uniref:E3 ubiquitin-protein ligase RNF14-like n=1 Tax=Hylaeus anthracinus TaxID=313031 RepID=UPI0023B98B2E|nr:E3 ubiquitin-protein ligase RNF14-like [Hylaeus anthracinus]
MLQEKSCNQDRQESEMLILSNIYNFYEFSYVKEGIMQCYYNVFPNVSDGLIRLRNIYKEDQKSEFHLTSNYFIKYLPPVRMYLRLPDDYPSRNPPNFYIISSWLSPWQISFICQKLDEIWLHNRGQEILFLWFEFLKHDLLNFLRIKDDLDVSYLSMIYKNLSSCFELNLIFKNDIRAVHSILFSDPVQFLINYHKQRCTLKFEKNYSMCTICFEEFRGKECIKLETCSHIYCKNCMQKYITITINEGTIGDITCPSSNCNFSIAFNDIKDLCPDLFSKYESLLLQITLKSMNDVIFCPRISCQCPLVLNTDDTLAICSKCDYAFCIYCYKVYHGVEPCFTISRGIKKLIEDYKNANNDQKQLLRKKYGRQQIQRVVENHLAKEYLKKNAKTCPNCQTMIVKIDGCNKMRCIHCKADFCWLCGTHITSKNPYEHFLSLNNSCYRRLFEISEENNFQL